MFKKQSVTQEFMIAQNFSRQRGRKGFSLLPLICATVDSKTEIPDQWLLYTYAFFKRSQRQRYVAFCSQWKFDQWWRIVAVVLFKQVKQPWPSLYGAVINLILIF